MKDLEGFKVEKILSESATQKTVALLGRYEGQEAQAIVILTRRHFPLSDLQALVETTSLEEIFSNDIYAKFTGTVGAAFSHITVDTIHPCTEKHISKHSSQDYCVIAETPQMYQTLTKPFIDAIPPASIQWVYNVLEKKKEAERIMFEDPDPRVGFILAPDLKWDQVQLEQLYCLALVHRRDMKSIRDLDQTSIPLLQNVLDKGTAAICERFGVAPHSLKVYFHYHPSYYHLHVHFVHVNMDVSLGQAAGKAHLLQTVLDNISNIAGDYYQQATLQCVLGESDPLLRVLRAG